MKTPFVRFSREQTREHPSGMTLWLHSDGTYDIWSEFIQLYQRPRDIGPDTAICIYANLTITLENGQVILATDHPHGVEITMAGSGAVFTDARYPITWLTKNERLIACFSPIIDVQELNS